MKPLTPPSGSPETDPLPDREAGAAFEVETQSVLAELGPALARVIDSLRPPVRKAVELRRRLDLSQNVAWSVFNAATAGDPHALPTLLPGRRAMEGFFHAAAAQGAPAPVVERARAAFERFEESVARHAGSRDAYGTMVAALGGRPDPGADLKHKRAAFRAMALLRGQQVRVGCDAMIMRPGASGLLDRVFIYGMVGVQRTRAGVELRVAGRQWLSTGPQYPSAPPPPEPLDPRETGPDAIALLRDFCSQPLPELLPRETRKGEVRRYKLAGNTLGASGEVTYFTGQVFRAAAPPPGSAPDAEVGLSRGVGVPMAAYNGDILIHKSACDTRPPEVQVYALPADGSMDTRDWSLLPLTERGEYLGEGLNAARTPLVPRYAEMLAWAMERMGWNGDEFRVFRCRVDYPVLYSRIRMTVR